MSAAKGAKPAPADHHLQQKDPEQAAVSVPLIVSFRDLCVATAILPLVTLTGCFVSAYIYQSEEVHETHCKVYNVIPSISAITGVSPQRYLWRICIALHIGPRFVIAAAYRNFYGALNARFVPAEQRKGIASLVRIVFLLHVVEIAALCCVTYVSNRENYPVHEKFFITFMITSLFHMLLTIKLLHRLRPWRPLTADVEASLWWKKVLFAASLASTAGLIIFFLKHRLLCHDLAFSFFALCEYLIASANMGFHWTCTLDFPTGTDCIIASADVSKDLRKVFAQQFVEGGGGGGAVNTNDPEDRQTKKTR